MKKVLIFICVFYIFVSKVIAFSDNSDFYWAKDSIDKWSQESFISGYPDGTFRGNDFITRAEVISVVNKVNNSKENIEKRVAKDVEMGNWFFYEVGRGVKSGIISIDENGNIRPNDFATREEVMVILSKLLNISYSGRLENSKINSFSDYAKVNSKDFNRVAGIVEEGVITGYPDNTLRPDGNITRAEFITILNNLVKEVVSRGDYSNKIFNGNIVINDENVKITNSEVYGKVFVLDGAKNNPPELINTNVSKGINSRVGEILIKNESNYKTLSEYNLNKPDDYTKAAIAKITYSDNKWTNDNVSVNIKFDNNDVELVDGGKIIAKENGEYEVKYIYEGKLRTINVDVNNIDNIKPEVNVTIENKGEYANILVDIVDDGLSPIKEIRCSNGIKNNVDKETGEISKNFSVHKNGDYKVFVEDEAGNVGTAKFSVKNIDERIFMYTVEYYLQEEDGSYLDIPKKTDSFTASVNTNVLIADITSAYFEGYAVKQALKDGEEVDSFVLTEDALIKIYYRRELLVKYDACGGTNAPSKQIKYIGEDLTLSSDIPQKNNCEFLGWSLEKDNTNVDFNPGDVYTENTDTTLYAIWREITYTYTVEHYLQEADGSYLDSPEESESFTAKVNTNVIIADLTSADYDGYTVKHAIKDSEEVESFVLTEATLIKIYYKKELAVKYDACGGTNAPSKQIKYIGEDITLSSDIPQKSNCKFLGWSLENDDIIPEFNPGDIYTGNDGIILYAVWYDRMVNDPVLGDGMVAVNWNNFTNNWEEVSKNDWDYNYEIASKWENSAGMAEYGISGDGSARWANTAIDADNDGINESFYVWIPRYSYKIISGYHENAVSWNSDNYVEGDVVGKIEVKFSRGLDDYVTGGYRVHPAFTLGDKELAGIWVAKYEISKNSNRQLLSRPDEYSFRDISVSNAFNVAYNFNREYDSHLMKNSEWGAVSYLTNAIGRIPYINNSSSYVTGNAGNTQDDIEATETTNAWNTINGVKASSTHNVYGIYDLSGGSWEYVAAYLSSGSESSLENDAKAAGLCKAVDIDGLEEYVDVYENSMSENKWGDALYETSAVNAWDEDSAHEAADWHCVFLRGGKYTYNSTAGIYTFSSDSGGAYSDYGFRMVFSIQ